ncbi:MAG: SIR2 family NAD-dependent protein deacylase [Nitriliruptoraceae bacterium]
MPSDQPDAAGLDRARIAAVADRIRRADVVVVLTGAGVSTGSGIPDYRGPQGLWTKDPSAQRYVSIDAYVGDEEVRRESWRRRAADPSWQAEPNAGHRAIAELERLERLTALVTQNVDGLHLLAGSSPGRTIEIHGTIREVVCLDCGDRQPADPVLERVRGGEDDPRCARCGGLLKVATVSFGQSLDPALLQRAHDATMAADVFLAIGTSLTVHPVALLPRTALEAGASLMIVNAETTPYDDLAEVVLRSDTSATLTALVDALRSP